MLLRHKIAFCPRPFVGSVGEANRGEPSVFRSVGESCCVSKRPRVHISSWRTAAVTGFVVFSDVPGKCHYRKWTRNRPRALPLTFLKICYSQNPQIWTYLEKLTVALAIQIFRNFWNAKIHIRVHKSSPLVHFLSHVNPVHTPAHPVSFIFILIPSHLRLRVAMVFPSIFPTDSPIYRQITQIHGIWDSREYCFCDETRCNLVEMYWRFGGTYRLHLQDARIGAPIYKLLVCFAYTRPWR
jgi:hypothetical protein